MRIDTATGAPVGDVEFGAGRNDRLTNYHPSTSAVVILRARTSRTSPTSSSH